MEGHPGNEAAPAGEPRWLERAIAQSLDEMRLYLRTFSGVSLRPSRFAEAWASGELEAAGPLAFMATSAAIGGVAWSLFERYVGLTASHSLLREIGDALAPYAYYSAVGLLCHGLLRLFGPLRRWTTSLGIALFAGGAMPLLAYLTSLGLIALSAHFGRAQVGASQAGVSEPWLLLPGLVPLVWFFVSLARGLSGAHRAKGWKGAVVMLVPALITTFAPVWVPLPVMHAHVTFALDPDGLSTSVILTNH